MFKILHVLGLIILSAGLVLGGLYLADLRRSQAVAEELRLQVTPQASEDKTPLQPTSRPETEPPATLASTAVPTVSPRPTLAIVILHSIWQN